MSEIKNNEKKIDNPPVKEDIKKLEDLKKQENMGNNLDRIRSTGGTSLESKTSQSRVTEASNQKEIKEDKSKSTETQDKRSAIGAKLDNLSSTGITKENTEDEKEKKDVCATKIDDKVTDIEKEKLPNFISDTFKDGQYRTVVTNEDVKLYRTYGGNSEIGGSFATTEPSESIKETRQKSAILPDWNDCTNEVEITVPKGTKLNIGTAEQQEDEADGTIYEGGGDQVLLPQNWAKEHPEWITSIREIKENNND